MSNTYNWDVYKLNIYDKYEDEKDVVVEVKWILKGTDGQYSGSFFGCTKVAPYTRGEPFIPFESLTNDIVMAWTTSSMTPEQMSSYYQAVDKAIDRKKNPPPSQSLVNPPWIQ